MLDRAFRLLDAFDAGRRELTLGELVDRSGLPRSTVHRLAKQLERNGALEPTRRGWRVGVRMFELGHLVPAQHDLRELALPYMSDLQAATGEMVQLAVLDGADVVYVEVISGHEPVPSPSRRGGRMPAHCTAVGKALLAFAAPAFAADGPPLEPRTRRTTTDRHALRDELLRVRRAAVSFDHEESLEGLCCTAAPVVAASGRAVAAISVSMRTGGRLTPAALEPAVRMTAFRVSRVLAERGGRPA